MKSISKAMIAVMIAAAMCVVPLFVIEDAEAADITGDGKGVSFKAGSVKDDDFNKLANDDYKTYLCDLAFKGAVIDSTGTNTNFAYSEMTVKDVSNVKLAKGTDLNKDDNIVKTVDAMKITFYAKFTVTYTEDPGYVRSAVLFVTLDGTQDLYKELGTNKLSDGTILTVEGEFTMEDTEISTTNYVKTNAGALAMTEVVAKSSKVANFDGKVGFNNGVINKTITMKKETEQSTEMKQTYDYYGVDDVKDVVAGTKAFLSREYTNGGAKSSAEYKVGDVTSKCSKEYGMEYMEALSEMMAEVAGETLIGYTAGTAETLGALVTVNISAPDYYYCTDNMLLVDNSLFYAGYVQDASLKTNDGMKSFLEGIGTASTEISDVTSVANDSYTEVSVGGGSGGNNIIFYVIIGVLAVAVVALAVLLIKKK